METGVSVLLKPLQDLRVRALLHGRGDDARVEKIPKRHRETSRPMRFSRMEAAKSFSTPTSSSEYFLRKVL